MHRKILPALAVLLVLSLMALGCEEIDDGSDPFIRSAPTVKPAPGIKAAPTIRAAPTIEAAPGFKAAPTIQAAPTIKPAPAFGGDVVKVKNLDQGGSGEYKFVPSEYTFEVGETVTFEMSGETEFHTFTVDDLDIDESVDGGQTVTFTVKFDRAGTFKLICIPHEAFGMMGTITVK